MRQEDADRVLVLESVSRLPATSPDEVHQLVLGQTPADSDRIDRVGLSGVIRDLLLEGGMSNETEKFATEETVLRVWASVADQGAGGSETAPWKELASGLGVLSWGSKSEKLGAAWRLFENDRGQMTIDTMSDFLRSQLGALVSLSGDVPRPSTSRGPQEPAAEVARDLVRSSVASAAQELAQRCYVDVTGGDEADGGVDFGEFGQWFNSGGRQLMPWLEVLDLTKWPGLSEELIAIHDAQLEMLEEDEEQGRDDDGEDEEAEAIQG